jgi:hypothetical protein
MTHSASPLHKVETGGVMTKALPEDNPCRKAYIDYNVGAKCMEGRALRCFEMGGLSG